jgi:cytochrome c5
MKAALIYSIVVLCFAANARADDASDKQAYEARCAKCHGESGTGTFMLGRRYGKEQGMLERRTDLLPALVRHVVRNGIVSMPAITRVEVTDEELDAIVRYLTRKQTSG